MKHPCEADSQTGRLEAGPRRRTPKPRTHRPWDYLGPAPTGGERRRLRQHRSGTDLVSQNSLLPTADRPCKSSRRPAVLRLLITRPGGVSPRSHSSQWSRSLRGSGSGRFTRLILPARSPASQQLSLKQAPKRTARVGPMSQPPSLRQQARASHGPDRRKRPKNRGPRLYACTRTIADQPLSVMLEEDCRGSAVELDYGRILVAVIA